MGSGPQPTIWDAVCRVNCSDQCSDDVTQLLETAVVRAREIAECDVAAVHLAAAAPWTGDLRLAAQRGLTAGEAKNLERLPAGQGLAGHVAASGVALLWVPGEPLPPGLTPLPHEAQSACCAAVPLDCGTGGRGVLWVLAREECPSRQRLLATLEILAECACSTFRSRLLHESIALERDRYQRLAANVGDCFWSLYLTPEMSMSLMSEGVRELTGYAREEFVAQPQLWLEIVHPDDRWITTTHFARVRDGEAAELHYRYRITRRDGDTRWLHTRGRAVRDDHGLRVDAISSDVTDHVRLEEKVRRADRLSAVGMLAGGIAHEYNNLHFAILGTLDLLLMRDDLDEGLRQHINRVREAAERASEITTNLVAFARGGTGARSILNLSELVDSTLAVVRKEFGTSGIELVTSLDPHLPPVQVNRAELGQVLINLVINARQAMADHPTRRLTVTTGVEKGLVFARFHDSGHGISTENLPRLFDPFFTTKGAGGSWLEERSQSDAYLPGRGLGLSVAQTIVREHGGEIEVESTPGEGATFTVYLPTHEPEGGVLLTHGSVSQHRKGKILVADDEPSVRSVCRELLQHLDYEVTEAEGGAEALELLTQGDYALVLVDLRMPDMDGLELIRRINEAPLTCRPAKLVITGLAESLDSDICAELGIASTIQKPASLLELTEKVHLALTRGPM